MSPRSPPASPAWIAIASPLALLLLLLAISIDLSLAQQQPANCNGQLNQLIPCLSYVQGQATQPAQGCCSGLKSIAGSNPACLCSLISANAGSIPGINSTLALELPAKCNLQGLNPSLCSGNLQAPASAPVLAPQTSPLKQVAPAPGGLVPALAPQTAPFKQVVPAPAPAPRRKGGHRHRRPVAAPAPVTASPSPVAASQAPALAPSQSVSNPFGTGSPRPSVSSGDFNLPCSHIISGALLLVLGMF